MSLSINSNLTTLTIQRQLKESSGDLTEQLKRLSSGLRINSASDDPAGLAISQKQTAQIRGQSQSIKNIQDGLSMLQTASGGARKIESNLQRIRELSVQAGNGTLTNEDRGAIQSEVDQLKEEINRISEDTQFNKKNLLNGDIDSSNGGVEIQAGSNEGQTLNASVADLSTSALGVDSVDVATASGAEDAIEAVDDAISNVSSEQSNIGTTANRLTESINVNEITRNNMEQSRSKIRDTDVANASVERTQASIRTQAGSSLLAQANELQGSNALQLLE